MQMWTIGWRVEWAIDPSCVAFKVTNSAPTQFQKTALTAFVTWRALGEVGFNVQFKPLGSFFIFAVFPKICKLTDVEFVEELIKQAEVVNATD